MLGSYESYLPKKSTSGTQLLQVVMDKKMMVALKKLADKRDLSMKDLVTGVLQKFLDDVGHAPK